MTKPINNYSDEYKKEKRSLLYDGAKLGILLLVYEILQNIVSNIYYYAAYFFITKDFSTDRSVVVGYFSEHQSLLTSTAFKMTRYVSTTILCVGTVMILAKFLLHTGAGKFLKPSKGFAKTAAIWFPGCFLINAVFTLLFSYIMAFFSSSGISIPSSDLSISSPSKGAIIMQFAYTIIVAPMVEEYIYRGLVLGSLSKYSKSAAVLFSALSFGLMHGNLPQAVSAFLTGLLYAAIAVNCGSIIPTIIIHSLNNIFAGFPNFAKAMNIPHYETIYSAFVIIIALGGLFTLCTHHAQLNIKQEDNGPIPLKKVNKYIFTNPFLIFYLCALIFLIAASIVLANR